MLVRIIGFILAIIGAAGFLMPFWIGAVVINLDELELPLSQISDVAISEDGEIFFALTFLGRIQKYSSGGKFIQGFDIHSDGGQFCLTLIEDKLTVYVARRDAKDKYDLAGNVIRQNIPIDENSFRRSCVWDERVVAVGHSIKRVAVSLKGVDEPIFISKELWHYLALNPFASWLMFAAGLLLIPEWRRSVFSAFSARKASSKTAKPKETFLKVADFILNVIFTLYALVFTTIGILIIVISTYVSSSEFDLFTAALGVIFVIFSLYWIYKRWTTYDSVIRVAPGISFEVGAAGAVAWKAFQLLLLAAFIFSVFYFGSKIEESRNFESLSVNDQLPHL